MAMSSGSRLIIHLFSALAALMLLGAGWSSLALAAASNPAESVVIHSAPAGYPAHPSFSLTVEGKPAHVYATPVSLEERYHPRPYVNKRKDVGFAIFDHARPVKVEVHVRGLAVQSAEIKPRRLGIKAEVSGDRVRFTLPKAGNYIVEFNHDVNEHLYLFTNAPEKDAPSPGDPNVIHFGPGLHKPGAIRVTRDGQTIYLAPGAVVQGWIDAKDVKNLTLCGRGILLGGDLRRTGNMIYARRCQGVNIRDVVIVDSPTWTARFEDCTRLDITRLRQIGWRQNCDGIDLMNCEDVRINETFHRLYDDPIVIKVMRGGSSRRIDVRGALIVNDSATPLKIGANEMMGAEVRDVRFADCDLVSCRAGAQLGLNNLGTARVSNVRFEEIRIDGARISMTGVRSGTHKAEVELVRMQLGVENAYSKSFEPGSISDVTFKNITYDAPQADAAKPASYIRGLDRDHRVANVVFENLVINGKRILNARDGNFEINEFAGEIKFR